MFQRLRHWLIELLDASPNENVLTDAVAHVFNTIGVDDILREERGVWMVGNQALPEARKKMLVSEAKTLLNMMTWRLLTTDIKYQANKRMFLQSKSEADLILGKSWLYVLDTINTRLNSLSHGSGVFNDDALRK